MKKSEWNEALNHIDNDLVEKYVAQKDAYTKRRYMRKIWIRTCAIVACIAIVLCSFTVVPMLFNGENNIPNDGIVDGMNGSDINGGNINGSDIDSGIVTQKPTNEFGCETYTSIVPIDTLDFGGDSITILYRDTLSAQREWYKDIREDDLDEVISMRNEEITKTLNMRVKYKAIGGADYADCLDTFTTAIKSDVEYDLHEYDVVANHSSASVSMAIRDYLANIADSEKFPYFEFTLPCWNQSIVKNTKINSQLYYITGDINLSTFDNAMVIFLNKKMYDEKKTADDPKDMQDLALEGYDYTVNNGIGAGVAGGFTYDELYRWSSVFEESNGKNAAQSNDFYAISSAYDSIPLDSLPYAWNLDYIIKNADDTHSYNIVGNSKIEEAITKARQLLDGSFAVGVSNENIIANFAADNSIFALHVLYNNENDSEILRNMSSEYGLLPMPKYDKNQLDYGTTAYENYTLMTVINHEFSSVPTKGKMISAYLQYSAEESYTGIRRYYIEDIIKSKNFSEDNINTFEKSVKIFNIVANNIELSFASVYAPQLDNILQDCWRDAVIGGISAKDAYQSKQDVYDTRLAELDFWLGLS